VEKGSKIKTGDIIIFKSSRHSKEKVRRKVSKVRFYPTLKQMLENESIHKIIPGIELAIDVPGLKQFYEMLRPGYLDRIEKYGILAFYLEELEEPEE